jgi:hypothetical protein
MSDKFINGDGFVAIVVITATECALVLCLAHLHTVVLWTSFVVSGASQSYVGRTIGSLSELLIYIPLLLTRQKSRKETSVN